MNRRQLFLIAMILILTACKKDDMVEKFENNKNLPEVITKVVFTMVNTNGGKKSVFSYSDIDGVGGMDPIVSNAVLDTNTIYRGSISFINEAESPVEDVTIEIIEESDIHQLFYEIDNEVNLTVIGTDRDANGNRLGLKSNIFTGEASLGKLKITLQHDVVKPNNNNLVDAEGKTDISVEFDVLIE